MKNNLFNLLILSSLAVGLSACMESRRVLDNPPGKYERTTSSTDSYGTTTKQESSTEVDVDNSGNKKAVVKKKTTKDPKGLFNKSTTESEQVIEENKR